MISSGRPSMRRVGWARTPRRAPGTRAMSVRARWRSTSCRRPRIRGSALLPLALLGP